MPTAKTLTATIKSSSVDIPKTTPAIVAPKTSGIGTWTIVRCTPITIKATVATRLGPVIRVTALISVIHPTVFVEVLSQLLTLGIGTRVVSQSAAILARPLRVSAPIGDV
jgi:hypothetical protein